MNERTVKLSASTAKRLVSALQDSERKTDYVDTKTHSTSPKRDLWLQVTGREQSEWQSDKYVYLADVYVGLYDEEPLQEDVKVINSLETFQEGPSIGIDMVLKAIDFVNKDDKWYYVVTGDYPLEFWVEITSSSLVTTKTNTYEYAWKEKIPNKLGAWQDKPAGRTAASTGWKLYNTIEANNPPAGASGILGNSIDQALLPPEATMLPAQGNPIARVRAEWNCDHKIELHVMYWNAIKPICAEIEEE